MRQARPVSQTIVQFAEPTFARAAMATCQSRFLALLVLAISYFLAADGARHRSLVEMEPEARVDVGVVVTALMERRLDEDTLQGEVRKFVHSLISCENAFPFLSAESFLEVVAPFRVV